MQLYTNMLACLLGISKWVVIFTPKWTAQMLPNVSWTSFGTGSKLNYRKLANRWLGILLNILNDHRCWNYSFLNSENQMPSPFISPLQLWNCSQPQHKLHIPVLMWPFVNATTRHITDSKYQVQNRHHPQIQTLYSLLHTAPISSLVSVPTKVPATARASMCDWHINNQACPPPRQIQMHLSKWWSTRPQGSIVYIFTPLFTKVRF